MSGQSNSNININYSCYKKDIMELKVKKLTPEAQLPKYMTDGAAGFDVRVIIEPGETTQVAHGYPVIFRTGLAFEVPQDHVMLAFSRSGMGFKHDLRLSNCVGVIDSDYRGELFVKLAYDGTPESIYDVQNQERVLQCVVLEAKQFAIVEVDELSTTVRGENGSGSTGKV
jgi:dUTP pyrophosphatase